MSSGHNGMMRTGSAEGVCSGKPNADLGVLYIDFDSLHRTDAKLNRIKRWLLVDDERVRFDGFENHRVYCRKTVAFGDSDVQKLLRARPVNTFTLP